MSWGALVHGQNGSHIFGTNVSKMGQLKLCDNLYLTLHKVSSFSVGVLPILACRDSVRSMLIGRSTLNKTFLSLSLYFWSTSNHFRCIQFTSGSLSIFVSSLWIIISTNPLDILVLIFGFFVFFATNLTQIIRVRNSKPGHQGGKIWHLRATELGKLLNQDFLDWFSTNFDHFWGHQI